MGTSGCYKGPGKGSPLIPSWLDGDGAPNPDVVPVGPNVGQPGLPAPQISPTIALQGPRSNMTRYVKTDGTDRPRLARALSQYAKATGGGGVQRIKTSKISGVKLLGFLASVREHGERDALRGLRLEHLAGQPVETVFAGLAEVICPLSGSIEDGLTREAFFETIAAFADEGITDLSSLVTDQIKTILELFVVKSIEGRLLADIATKNIFVAADVATAKRVQKDIEMFIQGCVTDAVAAINMDYLPSARLVQIIDDIYDSTFNLMALLGQSEGEQA